MKTLLISIFCLGLVQPALPARVQPAREYILILEDTPLARQFHARTELRSAAALSHGARIGQAQQRVRNALAGRSDIRVVGSVRTLLNAVFVRASEKNLPELRSLAGVKYVVPSKRFKLHLNTALPLVRAQQAWAALNSAGYPNPGEGIKIGIIDTGIDQTHPALQDSSLTVPGGFPKCAGAECAYTSNKVIVAHSYVYLSAQGSDPQNRAADDTPDDLSPRDRVGHGTAAAVIAAGMETKAPLATISGVAPKAFLGNYKVFGSPGVNDGASSSAIITALDDALNEGMDIATMSLGFPAWYGPEDTGADCGAAAGAPCEAEAQAVDAAGQQGMIVVVSAGNDGDAGAFVPTLSTIHTPGIAPSAITVGASRNGHEFYSQVSASGPGAPDNVKNLAALFGGGPVPSEPLTAPLVDIKGLGCASVPSSVSGAIALVQRGSCDFSVKVANAQQAGAVGVIFYCNNTQYCSDGGEIPFVPGGLSATSIPAVVVGMTSGKNLAAYADAHSNNAQATLNPGLKEYVDPNANNIAEFSSRGPSIAPETALKPELVAVGTNVYTGAQDYDTNGAVYDKSRYAVMDGTSFSVPMVAGAAALVWQRNPSFSAAQVKSALVNTASTDITENGGTASILTVGAGKLNAESAVKTSVTVVPSTVTFGAVPAGGLLGPNAQRILRITNPTSSTLTLAVQANADANRLSLSRTSVGQHTTADVTVTFKSGEPAAGSYTGVITVTGGPVPLRVPYFYAKGDGVPDNMIPLTNSSFDGTVNSLIPGWATLVRVIDRYGLAVPNEPVTWETDGGASISNDPNCSGADAQTDIHGIAGACVMLGSQPDTFQDIFATVGSGTGQITYQFEGFPRAKPAITVNP
ncbi:MAG TPA: S8 family serine peptidase, partial [Bryobacteraceae bacterium]|nr:S8 family serine peptidase [Bryobacteraceae bacterium]